MGQNERIKHIGAVLQPSVKDAVVNIYNRYINYVMSTRHYRTMSFSDFLNQILMLGIREYNEHLFWLEKEGA